MKKGFFISLLLTFMVFGTFAQTKNEKAEALFKARDYAAALEAYKEIIYENPKDADALFSLGCMYCYGYGCSVDYNTGILYYEQAAELNEPRAL